MMQLDLDFDPPAIRSVDRVRQFGEVFTPSTLVQQMLDTLPAKLWSDPTSTFLEPACGNGAFLVATHDRLMHSLRPSIPNAEQRHRHIIEHMLYGVDILADNVAETVTRLRADRLRHHIVVGDTLAQTPTELFGMEAA